MMNMKAAIYSYIAIASQKELERISGNITPT